MQENRFFTILWRFNAVVFAITGVLLIAISLVVLLEIYKDVTRDRHVHAVVGTDSETPQRPKYYSYGSPSTGTNGLVVLPLLVGQTFDHGRYDKGSSNNIVNYLFLGANGQQSWMFPTHAQLILNQQTLFAHKTGDEEPEALAQLLQVVEKDTNIDQRLTRTDVVNFFLTDPDFQNPRRVLSDISGAFRTTKSDTGTLYIQAERKGQTVLLEMHMQTGEILSEHSLPTPGAR